MIEYTLAAAFLLGISGSMHCIGMCGPLVLALPAGGSASTAFWGRLLYQTGRISVYSLLGSIAGIIGGTAYFLEAQSVFSVVGGMAVIFLAFGSETLGSRLGIFRALGGIHSHVRGVLSFPSKQKTLLSMIGAGIANGFLPCGLIIAALAGAAVMQSPLRGAAFMASFGAGTLPVMLGISLFSALRSPRLRPFFRIFTPVGAVFAGILLIYRGLTMSVSTGFNPHETGGRCTGIKLTISAPR